MSDELKERLLKIIAEHGDGWWNDEDDEEVSQANAVMVLDELQSFFKEEGISLVIASE